MDKIKYQLVWQWCIYEPLSLQDIIMWWWEVEWISFIEDKEDWTKKWDRVSIPSKDYKFFSEEENDYWVWRQYTWLTDKNWKEIYEWDYVIWINQWTSSPTWIIIIRDIRTVFINLDWGYDYEVIGNIYETK